VQGGEFFINIIYVSRDLFHRPVTLSSDTPDLYVGSHASKILIYFPHSFTDVLCRKMCDDASLKIQSHLKTRRRTCKI